MKVSRPSTDTCTMAADSENRISLMYVFYGIYCLVRGHRLYPTFHNALWDALSALNRYRDSHISPRKWHTS